MQSRREVCIVCTVEKFAVLLPTTCMHVPECACTCVCVCVTSQYSAGGFRGRYTDTDDVSSRHYVLLLPLLPRLPTS